MLTILYVGHTAVNLPPWGIVLFFIAVLFGGATIHNR